MITVVYHNKTCVVPIKPHHYGIFTVIFFWGGAVMGNTTDTYSPRFKRKNQYGLNLKEFLKKQLSIIATIKEL